MKKLSILCYMLIVIMSFTLFPANAKGIPWAQEDDLSYPFRGIPTQEELDLMSPEEAAGVFEEINRKQTNAILADLRLHEEFELGEHGQYLYPDYFGGTYVDNFILHICLKDYSWKIIQHLKLILKDYQNDICFVPVNHSYKDMDSVLREFTEILRKSDIHLYAAYIQIPKNAIIIRLKDMRSVIRANEIAQKQGIQMQIRFALAGDNQPTANLRGGD